MRIKRFYAENLHGYLKFQLNFNARLTLLTGINGTGKTTALNCVSAMITPDLLALAEIQYDRMVVEIESEGTTFTITVESGEYVVRLSVSHDIGVFEYRKFLYNDDVSPARQSEYRNDYYREIAATQSSSPALKFILELPTPMFLGLDRRPRFDEDFLASRRHAVPASGVHPRNIFSTSLHGSLNSAKRLAQNRYREISVQSSRISEKLQREILLNLITVTPGRQKDFARLTVPVPKDFEDIKALRRSLRTLSEITGIDAVEVNARVQPFLEMLESSAAAIPRDRAVPDILNTGDAEDGALNALMEWSVNQSHLQRIKTLSETIDKYNRLRQRAWQPIEEYRALVNGFLSDSGKELYFDDFGAIGVRMGSKELDEGVSALSSGELQIFVILTHLSFNPLAQRDNVFIVDEPELSLHIQWQELFVDSVMAANPNIQYVMATHSPSIIMDKVKDCVELKKVSGQVSGRGLQF